MSRKNAVGASLVGCAAVAALSACATTAPGPDPYLARQLACIDAGRVEGWSEGQIDACRANVRASLGDAGSAP